ncbi:MAG: diguanylate cyclase [Pseudomonadota bacterium]
MDANALRFAVESGGAGGAPAESLHGGTHRRRASLPQDLIKSARTQDFRAMMDDSFFPILVHRDFKPLYANTAYARLNGYDTPAEVIALTTVKPLIAADHGDESAIGYRQLTRGERTLGFRRHQYHKPNGESVWVSLFDQVIQWQGQDAVQVTLSDITDQVEAETAVAANEARVHSILKISPFPVMMARAHDYEIIFCNDQASRLLDETTGFVSNFFVNKADWTEILSCLDAAGLVRDFEVQLTSSGPQEKWVLLSAVMMVSGGEPALLFSFTDISQRKALENELTRQATTDGLTGCYNRRHFMMLGNHEFQRSRRYRHECSLLMIDIDAFKSINDEQGHPAGDEVIKALVKITTNTLRECDIVGRFGGEEFLVLLPETPESAAVGVAERLRKLYEEAEVTTGSGATIKFTASLGLASQRQSDTNFTDILTRSDLALYQAKAHGRNKVVLG